MTFDIDESLVLLRAIFPHYPELHEQKPPPDPETLLSSLRGDMGMGPTKDWAADEPHRR